MIEQHPNRAARPRGDIGCPEVFWVAESQGPITTLRFAPGALLSGVDLQRASELWRFFDTLLAGAPRILRITIPSGDLSHRALLDLYGYLRGLSTDEAASSVSAPGARQGLVREDHALQRFMAYLRNPRVFVIADVQGEIDLNLFGLVLACDYRIASEESVLVNQGHPLGAGFGTAAPWFVARAVGELRAMQLLLGSEPISARRACELGLFDRITAESRHALEATQISLALSAKGLDHLLAVKARLAGAALPLNDYFATRGAGFNRQPPPLVCVHCGYNLTGNLSGICPECGSITPLDPKEPS